MVYRKAKQRVRRVYSRSKSILGGDIFKNPAIIGLMVGGIKNAATGKKIIDVESIKTRVSKMDGTNPLIFLVAGLFLHSPALTAIGAYAVIDPPDVSEKKEEYIGYMNVGENKESVGYSNVGENEESVGYSNIGESQEITHKRRCVF